MSKLNKVKSAVFGAVWRSCHYPLSSIVIRLLGITKMKWTVVEILQEKKIVLCCVLCLLTYLFIGNLISIIEGLIKVD